MKFEPKAESRNSIVTFAVPKELDDKVRKPQGYEFRGWRSHICREMFELLAIISEQVPVEDTPQEAMEFIQKEVQSLKDKYNAPV